MIITVGTKMPDTLSATFAIGAFVAAASLTIFIILERVVSSPTATASQRKNPEPFTVAEETESPTVFSAGILSPVRVDSLTELSPSITIPSTGILAPGFTINTSPFFTSSIGTCFSFPFSIITAVLGASSISPFKALVVLPFALDSNNLPKVINARIIAADSK